MNGQLPGQLLDDGPEPHCSQQCVPQGYRFDPPSNPPDSSANDKSPFDLAFPYDRGPLLSTALALFGTGSYLDIHHTITETYQGGTSDPYEWHGWGRCIDIIPFSQLLSQKAGVYLAPRLDPCVTGYDAKFHQLDIVANYLFLFAAETGYSRAKDIEDIFAASAFLAMDIFSGMVSNSKVTVFARPGTDMQIPHISRAGVILISVLLALYLASVLALSLYTAWTPRWTNQLDSFAIMRISGSLPNRFPLRLAQNPDKVRDLDELPGWIGDVSGAQFGEVDRVGELGLGGEMPLRGGAKYHHWYYDGDSGSDLELTPIRQRRPARPKSPGMGEGGSESSGFLS